MKRITMSIIIAVICLHAQAQQVAGKQEAIAVAECYARQAIVGAEKFLKEGCTQYASEVRDGRLLIHEIHFHELKVLVSGLKCCAPILAYKTSYSEDFMLEDRGESGISYFINGYCAEIMVAYERGDNTILAEWKDLANGTANLPKAASHGPLLTTAWSQSHSADCQNPDVNAYNYYVTKTCSEGRNCPTGCVATAVGQIMFYWKHPVYSPNATAYFDWCVMPNRLKADTVGYEKQRNAVARLLRDVGVNSNMIYCIGGCQSFTFPQFARDALVNYYGYSSDADVMQYTFHRLFWKSLIKNEINHDRPVFYAGADTLFGKWQAHAFVCHGYSANMFCMNFGHGTCCTWVTLDSIYDSDTHYNYHKWARAIFNLHPAIEQDICTQSLALDTHYVRFYSNHSEFRYKPYRFVPKYMNTLVSSTNIGYSHITDTISLHGSYVVVDDEGNVVLAHGGGDTLFYYNNALIVTDNRQDIRFRDTAFFYLSDTIHFGTSVFNPIDSFLVINIDTFYLGPNDILIFRINDTVIARTLDAYEHDSWRTIPSGAASDYVARKEIILRPGFNAELGSEFHAYIEPCEQCENEAQSQQSPPHGEQPGVQGDETMLAPADSAFWTICPSGENSDVRIHPNPTTGEFTLEYTQLSGNWTRCELYDLQGRHLRTLLNLSQPAGTYTAELSLATLPAGTYLLVLRNQARTSTQRIVKQ